MALIREENDDARESVRRLFRLLRNDPDTRGQQARMQRSVKKRVTLFIVAFPGGLYARHNAAPDHP
jgi:hypothetical protein